MKFSIAVNPLFKVPVSLRLYNATGTIDTFDFSCTFKRMNADEVKSATDGVANKDAALLSAALTGWDGIVTPAAAPTDGVVAPESDFPFTPENLETLLGDSAFVRAAATAFMMNVAGASEKN
jgi:hypothetical protein